MLYEENEARRADMLQEEFKGKIKRFTTKKLARILYECVECPEPRDGTDWLTAEKFVNQFLDNYCLEACVKKYFFSYLENKIKNPPDMTSLTSWNESEYQTMEKVLGRWVWDSFYQLMQKMDAIKAPYTRIKFH
jgi:hypothetical protein